MSITPLFINITFMALNPGKKFKFLFTKSSKNNNDYSIVVDVKETKPINRPIVFKYQISFSIIYHNNNINMHTVQTPTLYFLR